MTTSSPTAAAFALDRRWALALGLGFLLLYLLTAPAAVNLDGLGYLKLLSKNFAAGHLLYMPLLRAATRLCHGDGLRAGRLLSAADRAASARWCCSSASRVGRIRRGRLARRRRACGGGGGHGGTGCVVRFLGRGRRRRGLCAGHVGAAGRGAPAVGVRAAAQLVARAHRRCGAGLRRLLPFDARRAVGAGGGADRATTRDRERAAIARARAPR